MSFKNPEEYNRCLANDIYHNLRLFNEPCVVSDNVEYLISKYSILNNAFELIRKFNVYDRAIYKMYPNLQNSYTTLCTFSEYWVLDLHTNSIKYPDFRMTFEKFEQTIRNFIFINRGDISNLDDIETHSFVSSQYNGMLENQNMFSQSKKNENVIGLQSQSFDC